MEYNDSVVKTDVQHPQVYSPTFFCEKKTAFRYVVWRLKDGDREETSFVNREGDKKIVFWRKMRIKIYLNTLDSHELRKLWHTKA